MRNLIALLIRFSSLITFVVLEIICFVLIVNYNASQKDIWINSSNLFSGSILETKNEVRSFLDLEDLNKKLQEENALLKESLLLTKGYSAEIEVDTSLRYEYIPASIFSQEYRLRNNFLTINKGIRDSIKVDMGVINNDGVVGIIKSISNKYSLAISLLNTQTRISASIKSSNYFGNLYWEGRDPSTMTLESIPRYAEVKVGDTIVTSGYSTIFPRDLDIGIIESFEIKEGTSNLDIKVKLSADMTNLSTVYIINNRDKEEIKALQAEDE